MQKRSILKGKTALITGGTSGIGRATAILLAQNGANVVIFGRHEKKLNDALDDIRKFGKHATGLTADVTIKDDIKKIFGVIDNNYGGIDILINNASLPARSIVESNFSEMRYVLEANVLGYMSCSREAIKRMGDKGSGHIVNIGSMSAIVKEGHADLYVATKSAVEGFTISLRKKINRMGIKVSLIQPGNVGTDMVSETPKEQRKMEKLETMLKAEDVAEAILFCLSRPERCDIINIEIKPHRQYI